VSALRVRLLVAVAVAVAGLVLGVGVPMRGGPGGADDRGLTPELEGRSADAGPRAGSSDAFERDSAQAPCVYVLTYHMIHATRAAFTVISPGALREQLAMLRDEGHRFVTMSEVIRFARGELDLPDGAVALTFDDGYPTDMAAAGIVEEYGARASFFVYEATIDGSDRWDDLARLVKRGHEVQCHSKTHADLVQLAREGEPALREEIVGPEERLQRDVPGLSGGLRAFAYPYGFYSDAVVEAIRECGAYTAAVTIDPGPIRRGDDLMSLRRDMIRRSDDLAAVRRIVSARPLPRAGVSLDRERPGGLVLGPLETPGAIETASVIVNQAESGCEVDGRLLRVDAERALASAPTFGVEVEVALEGGEVLRGGVCIDALALSGEAGGDQASSGSSAAAPASAGEGAWPAERR
jgi:peptidoglycan/xylan/chitin deacetylase (PgdA/CDA1 family)